MRKPLLIVFGGISPEHEVSVVTGLQTFEKVDITRYDPLALFIDKQGSIHALPSLTSRHQFFITQKTSVTFGRDDRGGFISFGGMIQKKIYPHAAYLCLHGGMGEGCGIQVLLESVGITFTSSGVEGSVIAMNKALTKEVLRSSEVPVLPFVRLFSNEVRQDLPRILAQVSHLLSFPVIVKPAHLGSSIGITVAKSTDDLERSLLEASFIDTEILIEPFLTSITEFNCAVKCIEDQVITSPIERPIPHDDILSFADKYERGGKKSGMASLTREVPAKISTKESTLIADIARRAFIACRLKGMARIDFMQDADGALFLTEVNSIPGSMAFYLWEAAGLAFQEQITELVEQAVRDATGDVSRRMDYETDIITHFVQGS